MMEKTNGRMALRTLSNNTQILKPKDELNKTYIKGKENVKNFSKIYKPLEKTTLVRKMEKRYFNSSEETPLEKKIYEDDSHKEYIKWLLVEESNHIHKVNFIEQTVLSVNTRLMVVDWLLKIQQDLKIPENEFYLAIKIFDVCLHICADSDECMLLAITSLWIVHKFSDNFSHITASDLLPLLNGKFLKKHILAIERKILTTINFKIPLPEPSIFLEHFLRKVKQHEKKDVYFGSFFVCDCISMFPKFSSVEASFIAALSLYTTLMVLKQDTKQLLHLVRNIYSEDLLRGGFKSCLKNISFIEDNEKHQQPFVKYATISRMNIAKKFRKCK